MSLRTEPGIFSNAKESRYLIGIFDGAGLGGAVLVESWLQREEEQCWSMNKREERVHSSPTSSCFDRTNATVIAI